MEIAELSKSGIMFSALKLSRWAKYSMLKWETYNLLVNWKETILEPSKSRFKRSRSDFQRKNMLKSPTKNYRLKSITATF